MEHLYALKILAKPSESFQNDKINVQYADKDGTTPNILLAIQKLPSGNTVAISDSIYALLDTLIETELPASVEMNVFYDQSQTIRASINDVELTLIVALILVVFVIALYLGKLADTIIPSIVMPMTIIATFIVMRAYDFTLDNLSLLALTLAVGFIIDDAIVVLENIVRHHEKGENIMDAALEGSKQIGFTIVSMTLSLVAVFLPMLLMGGLIGLIFREFAITLTAVTVISGIISLTLTPMLCSRYLAKGNGKFENSGIFLWSKNLNERMRSSYGRMLNRVLDHQITALIVGLVCLVATLFLFYVIPVDFIPDQDAGFFIAYTQGMEAGSSQRLLNYEKQVMEIVRNDPNVQAMVAVSSYSEYRKGQNLIVLKPPNDRGSIKDVIDGLGKKLSDISGLQVFMKNVPLIDLSTGVESRGDYQLALESIYPDKVFPSAKKLIAKMQGDPMFTSVSTDLEIESPQINVNIMRDQASAYGLTATDIENSFNFSYSYNYITRIDTDVDQYNVILELLPNYQMGADIFNQLWMRSSISGDLVPMGAVAKWEESVGDSSNNHIDQFPSVTIEFNLAEGVSLSQATDKLDEWKKELVDPEVMVQYIGAIQTFQESIQNSGYLLLLAIFAIYIILGMLYESFIHPVTVLTTLPPATLGGLLVLVIFGLPLSMYAFLGIILLIGIVKKNGIMMIDFALDNIRTKGMAPREAILDACLVRFRPIMMTTFAAIFGAIPIALGLGTGAEYRRPLGLVIIGGLCLSQLITLFVTPILYLMFERVNEKLPWK